MQENAFLLEIVRFNASCGVANGSPVNVRGS